MRREDAPRAGWYPDPESHESLRFWDGLDWTDARRAPPSQAELLSYEASQTVDLAAHATDMTHLASTVAGAGRSRAETSEVIDEVRRATRSEIDRAAEQFSRRAQAMRRDIEPLISQYTNRLMRWMRTAAIIVIALLVAYFVFQVIAQASFFEWIGDRIDNLNDDDSGAGLMRVAIQPA